MPYRIPIKIRLNISLLESRCRDSCKGMVPQPGLCPLPILDPSEDVVVLKAAGGWGGARAQAGCCAAPAHPSPACLVSASAAVINFAVEAGEARPGTSAVMVSHEHGVWCSLVS